MFSSLHIRRTFCVTLPSPIGEKSKAMAKKIRTLKTLIELAGQLPWVKQWLTQGKHPGPTPTSQTVQPVAPAVSPVVEEPAQMPVVPPAAGKAIEPKVPACPFCKKTMVMKLARTGKNAGGNFWGCVDYPNCRGIRPIFAAMKVK